MLGEKCLWASFSFVKKKEAGCFVCAACTFIILLPWQRGGSERDHAQGEGFYIRISITLVFAFLEAALSLKEALFSVC